MKEKLSMIGLELATFVQFHSFTTELFMMLVQDYPLMTVQARTPLKWTLGLFQSLKPIKVQNILQKRHKNAWCSKNIITMTF